MKKLYSFIIASSLTIASLSAATIQVGVGINGTGTPASVFTPSAITANVGDVIQFIQGSTVQHNVTSTSVPATAAPMSSGTMSTIGQMYNYTVTVAGSYAFRCTFHNGMNGTMTVAAVGIADPAIDLLTQVYPNPFKDKLNVKYNGIEKVEFYNVVGEKVKSIEMDQVEGKLEVDMETLPSGIYFFRSYKDGEIVGTRKIVKAK
ncbi:MAG: copper binding protein plastocyanin [Bacteroidota bacterium]|jgi:plastocyanin|nr:copper binding protein plastocyanin [Bacteroidota bacterium]